MSEKQVSVDSWDGVLTNYLKPENIAGEIGVVEDFVCTNVSVSDNQDIELQLNRQNEKFLFTLNKTNSAFLKDNGIKIPRETIGKILTIKKTTATNPTLKKEVPALRIVGIK